MISVLPRGCDALAARPFRVRMAALFGGLLLLVAGSAASAMPPANTVIGNQASATYRDAAGNSQVATSNLVQTTVQQVGAFNLDGHTTTTTTVVNDKTGAAGTTVYAPHVLTNTGNGSDTFTVSVAAPASPNGFTTVAVFADANADGLPDSTTALCTATPAATCEVPAQTVAGNNGTFPFVVAYSIPAGATTANFSSPVSATVTARPGTPTLYATNNQSASDVDRVSLTTGAAFNASKSLSVPPVAWSAGGGPWPAASARGPRSSANCAATTTAAASPAAGCYYTTYTLRFNNTGAAAGAFALTDTLPGGFTYVPGSAVWSNAPGVALGDGAGGDPAGIDYAVSGSTLTFVVNSLAVNASQSVSFVVMVNSNAAIGTSTTTNRANYRSTTAADDGTTPPTSTAPKSTPAQTNLASYNVTASYGIVLGSATGSAGTSLDTGPDDPNTSAADTTTIASASAGSTITFAQQAFNTGNASDIVNLAVLTPSTGAFPAGTGFRFLAPDGSTPLIDNNGDGIVDTGPIAAGGSARFVLAVTLPSPTPLPAGPFNVIVKGTSAGDASRSESTRDTLTAMTGTLVDLTNTASGNGTAGNSGNGDVGAGPSPQPTTIRSTPAGTGTVFTLFVRNHDSVDNSYTLAASQTSSFPGSLPAGWTVKFVAAGGSCASEEITTLGVTAGAQGQYGACVTPPASQTPVAGQRIYFQVRSTIAASNGAIVTDTKTDAVDVTAPNTYAATLTPNNSGQVAPGGSVVYAHTLTNTGAQSCAGPYSVTATLPPADSAAGWTTALYVDQNGDGRLDAGDTLVDGTIAGPLPVGGKQKLLLKVFAPGGAAAGTVDTATVTVTFPSGATSCGTHSATDVTTVITGQIRLVKNQANDANCDGAVDDPTNAPFAAAPLTAKPGECILYRVVATNEGAAPVENLVISDVVPAYTRLAGATQPTAPCVSSGVSPAFSAANYQASTTTANCGTVTNTVEPGGTATLTFAVKVDNAP